MRELEAQQSNPIQTGVIKVPVDLNKTPTIAPEFRDLSNCCVNMGDMHGNAQYFIYRLAQVGILKEITDDQYTKLKELYDKHDSFAQSASGKGVFQEFDKNYQEIRGPKPTEDGSIKAEDDLKQNVIAFQKMLTELFATENINKQLSLRLLGDLLADRGVQDYFILLILAALKKENVDFEIIYSNHDHQFMLNAAHKVSEEKDFLPIRQSLSMENLFVLIEKNIVQLEEINRLVVENHTRYLKLFSYDLSNRDGKPHIDIYSHAPADFFLIEEISNHLGVTYKNSTAEELAKTLDAINQAFQKQYCKAGKLNEIKPSNPIFDVLWGRPEGVFTISNDQYQQSKNLLRCCREKYTSSVDGVNSSSKYLILPKDLPYSYTFFHGHVGQDHDIKDASINNGLIYLSKEPSALFCNLDSSNVGKCDTTGETSYFISKCNPPILAAAISDNTAVSDIPIENHYNSDNFTNIDAAASQAIASLEKAYDQIEKNDCIAYPYVLDQNPFEDRRDNNKKLEKQLKVINDDIQATRDLVQAVKQKPRNEQEKQELSEKINAYEKSANKWHVSTPSPEEKKANTSIYIKVAACMMVVAAIATCVVCPATLPFFLFLAIKMGIPSLIAKQVVTSVVTTGLAVCYGLYQASNIKPTPNTTFFPKTHMLNFSEQVKKIIANAAPDDNCPSRQLSTLSAHSMQPT